MQASTRCNNIIIGNIISICVNSRINYYFVLLQWHMSFKLCEIDCLLAKTIIRACIYIH